MPPAIANPRHRFVPIFWSCKSTPTQGKYLHTYIHASHAQNVNTDHKKALHPLSLFWFLQKPTPRQGFKSKAFLWGLITNITAGACGAGRPDGKEAMSILPVPLATSRGVVCSPWSPAPERSQKMGLRFLGRGVCPPPASYVREKPEARPAGERAAQTGTAAKRAGRGPNSIRPGPPGAFISSPSGLWGSHTAQPGSWDPQGRRRGGCRKPGRGHVVGGARGLGGLSERGAPPPAVLLSGAHPCAADLPPPQTSSQQVSPYCAPRWARAGVHRETGSRAGGAGAPGRLTEEKQEPEVTVVTSDLMGAGKSRTRGHGLQRSDNGAERLSQGGKEQGRPGDSSLHQPCCHLLRPILSHLHVPGLTVSSPKSTERRPAGPRRD